MMIFSKILFLIRSKASFNIILIFFKTKIINIFIKKKIKESKKENVIFLKKKVLLLIIFLVTHITFMKF